MFQPRSLQINQFDITDSPCCVQPKTTETKIFFQYFNCCFLQEPMSHRLEVSVMHDDTTIWISVNWCILITSKLDVVCPFYIFFWWIGDTQNRLHKRPIRLRLLLTTFPYHAHEHKHYGHYIRRSLIEPIGWSYWWKLQNYRYEWNTCIRLTYIECYKTY